MTYETIQLFIPNRKNLKLATEIFKPKGDGPFPVVFLFHGFKGYKEDAGLVDIGKRLAEKGLISVRFTSSCFGDSEGSISDYRFSDYRSDALCVFNTISEFSFVDSALIGVYGHSIGGKLAVLFCADHPDIRAVCIASAPVSFIGTEYEALLGEWKTKGYITSVSSRDKRVIQIPYEYVLDVDSPMHDVLAAAQKLHALSARVIVGDNDTEVPMKETKKIYDALACSKEFMIIQGMPHKYSREPLLIPKMTDPVVEFFTSHVKTE